MSYAVTCDITLRTARGITELTLRQLGEDQMTVEGEHTLRAGRQVEFQFALPGANFNLRGTGQVDKVVKLAIGPTRTILSIVEMNKNQRGVLREWLVAREQAEAVQRPTKKPPPPSVEEMRGLHSGSLASEIASPDSGIGRQAISEAITADPDRARGRRSQVRQGVQSRRGHDDPKSNGPRKRRRVEVKVASSATPPIVMIRFNDPERYVAYYWKHLHRDALQVRYEGAEFEKGSQVSVRLVLPGGSMVKCTGHVRVASAAGFGLTLDLNETARSTLRLSAGTRPRTV
jgi:hypothetical protein